MICVTYQLLGVLDGESGRKRRSDIHFLHIFLDILECVFPFIGEGTGGRIFRKSAYFLLLESISKCSLYI